MGTKQRGLTRAISFSNFTGSYLQQAIDTVGAESTLANQVEVKLFLQNHKVIDFAGNQSIHIHAYMPLAYGKVMQDNAIQRIADAHTVSPSQAAPA